jgi:gluconate kinase
MPPALLDSQFATLEPPGADEKPIVVDIGPEPAEIVAALVRRVGS